MNETEYAEFILKNMDATGKPKMSNSDFIRTSLVNARIRVNDPETEQYKCFILSKISNNLNQLTKRLHEDNHASRINDTTYQALLVALVTLNDEIFALSMPVR